MKPRVAVVMSGHVRTFQDCWPTWQTNVVEYLGWDCDYFVVTHELAERTDKSVDPEKTKFVPDDLTSRELVKSALETISPKERLVLPNDPDVTSMTTALLSSGIYRGREEWAKTQPLQTHGLKTGWLLLSPHIANYQLVVRLRFDYEFPIPLGIDMTALLPRTVITLDRPSPLPSDSVCDCFAIMNPADAEHYFTLHDTLVSRALSRRMRKYNLEIHLGMRLQENGRQIVKVPYAQHRSWVRRF